MKKRLDVEVGPFQFVALYEGLMMNELALKKATKGPISPEDARDLIQLLQEFTGVVTEAPVKKDIPPVPDEPKVVVRELGNGNRLIDGVLVEKRSGDLPKFYA